MISKPLQGITVIDLTHMLSGPFAGMHLADLGAETIKVEPLKGEGTRELLKNSDDYSASDMGAYFFTLNRNKQSVSIDLKSEAGLQLFYQLVEQADVVINNYGVGVPAKLKIDYEHLKQVNPRIITCSITGFGETGPDPKRPAFDLVAQGMGGGMSITGHEGGSPLRAGIPIGDLGGGMFAVMGVLAALQARSSTGRGQHVDISMLDCQISMLNYMASMYLMSGKNPEPTGNGHFVHVPYNTFRTQARHIIIAVLSDKFWLNLVEMFNDDALRDETFHTQPGRFANKEFINQRVQALFEQQTCEHWLARLKEYRIPSAPVNDFEHALSDPQVTERDMIVPITLPNGETVKVPGSPIKLSESNEQSYSTPPHLGEHTDTVLAEKLSMTPAQIAELRAIGAIG